jgi:dTMP kinase
VFGRIHGLTPDLTILIDLDVSIALDRIRERGAANRLDAEAPAFHGRVREAFLGLAQAEPARFAVFDGAGDAPSIASRIETHVRAKFGDFS